MTRAAAYSLVHESLRTHYLAAMGVDVYVPRYRLPGAKLSGRIAVPKVPAPVRDRHKEASGTRAEPPMRPGPSAVSQVLADVVPRRELEDATATAPRPSSPASGADSEDIRFTLNLWRVSASLLVIDAHHPRQALPTANLLSNMLRAARQPHDLPASESLRWPMLPHSQRLADARDMVSAFLSGRVAVQPVQLVWLMGEVSYKVCTSGQPAYDSALGQVLSLAEYGARAVVLPSLYDMLSRPPLKSTAWRALRDAHNLF